MKTWLVLTSLLAATLTHAQDRAKTIVLHSLSKEPLYQTMPNTEEHYFYFDCDFGKPELLAHDSIIDINKVQVTKIDLVFTDYPSGNDLVQLNTTRLNNLFKLYPRLAADNNIEWKLVRQTDGAEREQGMKMFHGFVIYYRPLQNEKTASTDLAKLKEMLEPGPGSTHKKRNGFITGDTLELRKNYEIEEYTYVGKMPVKKAEIYLDLDDHSRINTRDNDSVYVYEKPSTDTTSERFIPKPPLDSTVLKVLERMPWKNMGVVVDATASMYPYTGQLMLWLAQHEEELRIKRFTFFNDGDHKDEDMKSPGQTGGIYATTASERESVQRLLYKAMGSGNGGGAIPENNIEALLDAQINCHNCSELVMIADNTSPVSDMILLNKLKVPVHIIVCGMHDKLNPDLEKIAKATGGSIHLLEKDLEYK